MSAALSTYLSLPNNVHPASSPFLLLEHDEGNVSACTLLCREICSNNVFRYVYSQISLVTSEKTSLRWGRRGLV